MIRVGDGIVIVQGHHTFEGAAGTVTGIDPAIRTALFTDDLLHVALENGYSVRIFARHTIPVEKGGEDEA